MLHGSFIRAALVASFAVVLTGCPPQPTPNGNDIFRRAVEGSPGSLLSVWVEPGTVTAPRAFIAGGFVGVEHAAIADGVVGRLVEYETGSFTTRCPSDEVLWWVHGVDDAGSTAVFAAGEGGRVIRYQGGRCDQLTVDASVASGSPTFWGVYAVSPTDCWLVGGSASPTGPKGVLLHYDGTSFRQEADLPEAARHENLYKIDRDSDGSFYVVGAGGILMRRDPTSGTWAMIETGTLPNDNRLFTVGCEHDGRMRQPDAGVGNCWVVGGAGVGLVMRGRQGSGWSQLSNIGATSLDDLPGLNGVYVQDPVNVFIVGINGFTMHTDGTRQYRPAQAVTSATLHAVSGGGPGSVIIAVGGELGVNQPTQRGVILVRGDDSAQFTFDGVSYTANGELRRSFGGAGQ